MATAKDHHQKAFALLQSTDTDGMRYAALHLRMCMELLTYKKLKLYEERIPREVSKQWQPPQAVRALLALEPEADQDFKIEIAAGALPELTKEAAERANWLALGAHRTFGVKWLSKHYNKIGRLLHADHTDQAALDSATAKEYLTEVAEEVARVLSSTVEGAPAPVTTFACTACGETVARNTFALREGGSAICFRQDCGTEYLGKEVADGKLVVVTKSEYPKCTKCSTAMPIRPRQVLPDAKLACPKCGLLHKIAGQTWVYGPAE